MFNNTQFQFRYIADLYYSGSATRLARFKYPQNSSGTANIDLSRPINDYLDYDYNWKITDLDRSSTNSKRFTIEFGEEYENTEINGCIVCSVFLAFHERYFCRRKFVLQ